MKKVTEQELNEIKQLRMRLAELISTAGELKLNEFMLEAQLEALRNELKEQHTKFLGFQESERVLFDQLQEKYGTGNIDIETGEITE
jgi:hypothetical protein